MSVETIGVQRANKYLRVPADAVDRYIAKGYDVVDENDNVVVKSIPNDMNTLKMEYSKQLEEIEKLKAEVSRLKAELNSATTSKVVTQKKVEEPVITEDTTTKKRSKKN